MSNCNITTPILETLCISDSLPILNSNFSNLDTALCSLCSVSNNLIDNLISFGSIYNSSIFNVLNLINVSTLSSIPSIQVFTPSYNIYTKQIPTGISSIIDVSTVNNSGGIFVTSSPTIPNNTNFILLRVDVSIRYNILVTVNGINVPIYGSQISGLSTYPYASIPKANTYNVVVSYQSGGLPNGRPGRPNPTVPLNINIIGYF